MTHIKTVAALGLLAAGLGGCGGGAGQGNTLRLVGAGGQDDMDPTSAYTTVSFAFERAYARQLYAYPASKDPRTATTPVPDVAAGPPAVSADGLTYTITMRRGVMWDSRPPREMVAADFVRAFKHMCNPASPVGNPNYFVPNIAGMQAYCDPFLKNKAIQRDPRAIEDYENGHEIAGVTAPGRYTIRFRLTKPASDFVNLLATTFASAVPAEYYRYVPGSNEQFRHLVSAGPYRVSQFEPDRKIVFTRNPNWRKETDPIRNQYVDRIEFAEGVDNPVAVHQQLESGSADLSVDQPVPAATLGVLAADRDPNLTINGPAAANPYLVFNFRGPNRALADLKVRQAIEYAINKVALAKIYGGTRYNTPLHTVIPPGSVGHRDYNLYPTPGDQGDPSKCRALLTQAGYGRGLTLKAAYRSAGNHPAVFQSYAQDLKACGIDVVGVPVPQADFYSQFMQKTDNARAGKWDIAAPGWVPDWFGNNGRAVISPLFDGRNWTDGTSNYGGYNDPVTDGLIDKALTSRSQRRAAWYWSQADRQIMKDAAIVPFMAQRTPWYHSARVKGAIWLPVAQQFDYTNLWIDPRT